MKLFTVIALLILGVAAVLFLMYLLVWVRPRKKKDAAGELLCHYAHRGLHGDGVPENSLAAFACACEAGVGIELDVQLSRDGEVMVFHDYTLTRMTGCEKKLCELEACELKALSLKESDQTIPTFAQVLSLVNGRVPLLVELKGEDFNTSLCQKVAEQLRTYGGAYCVESFNPLLIRAMQKELPNAFCGLLYTNVCRDKQKRSALNVALTLMALNFLARPAFIAYNQQDRKSFPVCVTTRFYRAPRFVWTVKSTEELKSAKAAGECAIFEQISDF